MLYQTLSLIFAQLTHANINVHRLLDQILSYVIITPNMHKVHHHYSQPYTDSNYGNILAVWDRFFGTFKEVNETKSLKYGIDTHMEPKENNNLSRLLLMPFTKYEDKEGSKWR